VFAKAHKKVQVAVRSEKKRGGSYYGIEVGGNALHGMEESSRPVENSGGHKKTAATRASIPKNTKGKAAVKISSVSKEGGQSVEENPDRSAKQKKRGRTRAVFEKKRGSAQAACRKNRSPVRAAESAQCLRRPGKKNFRWRWDRLEREWAPSS